MKNGTVVSLGIESYCGEWNSAKKAILGVGRMYSNGGFAVLPNDGTMTFWKWNFDIVWIGVMTTIFGVKKIYSTYCTFAVVLKDGTWVTWGQKD